MARGKAVVLHNASDRISLHPSHEQADLLPALEFLALFSCIEIVIWTMYVSGWYVRELVLAIELSIQPFHTDQCGGLKVLGNFCFGLVSPILIGSALFIGYMFALFIEGDLVLPFWLQPWVPFFSFFKDSSPLREIVSHFRLLKKMIMHVRRPGHDFVRLCQKQIGTTF